MQEFVRLASGYYLEGLAADGDNIWYSDVTHGGVYCRGPDGAVRCFLAGQQWIGGIFPGSGGAIHATGPGGVRRIEPASGATGWLLKEIDGQPINGINEVAPDGRGGFWFGTCDLDAIIAGTAPRPVGIFHCDRNGTVTGQCAGLGFTNGMALSPDGRTLYCNESFDGTYAHDVAADGSLSNRRLFLKKPDCDGMAIDADGTVWITGFSSSHIARVAADGTVLEPLATPAQAITQCRFGGEDMRDLYFVSVPIDAGAGLAVGRLPTARHSHLYRTWVAVPGLRLPGVNLA